MSDTSEPTPAAPDAAQAAPEEVTKDPVWGLSTSAPADAPVEGTQRNPGVPGAVVLPNDGEPVASVYLGQAPAQPAPADAQAGETTVFVDFPLSSFDPKIDGVPVISSKGTAVPRAKLAEIQAQADRSGCSVKEL